MARDLDTNLMPAEKSITEPGTGRKISWPGLDGKGDFKGALDDANTEPSYLDSGWLSKVNRFLGRVFNVRGQGTLSENTTVAELASSVSPHWMAGGVYLAGAQVLHLGVQYLSTQNHTATATNAPGQNNAPWALLDTDASIAAAISNAKSSAISHADTQDAAHDLALLQKIFPVGTIYVSIKSTNPASLFGFGNWIKMPSGWFISNYKVISSLLTNIYFWRRTT